MPPCFMLYDMIDDLRTYSMASCDDGLKYAHPMIAANALNALFIEPRHRMFAATMIGASALRYAVMHIVGMCAEKQMRWPDA